MELPQQNTDGPDVDNGGPAVVVEDRDVQGGEAGEGDDEQLQASRQSRPSEVSLNLVTQVRRELRAEPTFLFFTSSSSGNISKYRKLRSSSRTFILLRRGQSLNIFSIVLKCNNQ